jgi:hypothetical protein
MILKLRTDDGQHVASWRITADAELTPEFLQPLLDAIARQRRIEALRESDAPNAAWEAITAEFDAVDEVLDNWDKGAEWTRP